MAFSISVHTSSNTPPLASPASTDFRAAAAAYSSRLSALAFPVRFRFRTISSPSRRTSRSLSLLVKAKKQTFSSLDDLLQNSDKPVLVDFYATWCGPCQFMVPILNEVSSRLIDKIQVVKIDTEKYPTIADKYSIQALPTFIIFKDGKPSDRFEGALTADELIKRIESSLEAAAN